VPVGTPVFLELGADAGIDGIAVACDADAFVVEFIAVDDAAAALIASALQPPSTLPRTRTDELGLPADAPVELPAFAVEPPVALPATERTGEFLASALDDAIAERDADGDAPSAPPAALTLSVDIPAADPTPAPPPPVEAATPSWVRAFDADLGDEPELPASGHTQRWPTAQATSSEEVPSVSAALAPSTPPGWPDATSPAIADPTPAPAHPDDEVATARWPATRIARAAPPPTTTPPEPATAAARPAAPTRFDAKFTTARWPVARVATASPTPPAPPPPTPPPPPPPARLAETTPEPATATPAAWLAEATPEPAPATPPAPPPDTPIDETARWPVARVALAPGPTPAAAPSGPPPLSFGDAEDVVLEFTAPLRSAPVSRPLPPPEDEGVVEVDFSEFRDVLGVATFKAVDARPTTGGGRISTPQPVSTALPRTPSTSHTPQAPTRNPFAGDSGVGARPDSTPPLATGDAPAGGDGQWVVTSPSLPAPRLLDRGLDQVLRSGGPNSVTPQPLPFIHDSTPPPTAPVTPATTTVPATTAPTTTAPTTTAPTTTAPATAAPTTTAPTIRPVVPPLTPVLAPRPPPIVPVAPPRPPPVLAPPPPRPTTGIPAATTVPPSQPVTPATTTVPPVTPAATTVPPVTPATTTAPPVITVHEEDVVTAPGGGVQVLPLTSSAEDLPLVLGDGEDIEID
jgi:hypothetical protein